MAVQKPVLLAGLLSGLLAGAAFGADEKGQTKGQGHGTTVPAVSPGPRGPEGKPAPPDPKEERGLSADPFAEKPRQVFEDLLKEAIPVTDLATLIEPLYARCDEKDDLPRRQCENIRAALLLRLRTHSFVTLSDAVPDLSPYDAGAREIDMEVPGCLICASPPVVAGAPRYLATRPPQRVASGRAVVNPLYSHQLTMDRVQADRFLEHVVPRLRVQEIFRVDRPFEQEGGAKLKGVIVQIIGHRVYDRCTGQIAAAMPPAQDPGKLVKVLADKSCPQKGAEELSQAEMAQAAQQAALPERLTPRQVATALEPVQDKVHDCYVEFAEVSGTARVQLVLSGEGKLTQIALGPPFDKAAIGLCIKSQIRTAVFPKFRGEPMRIDYAFQVN